MATVESLVNKEKVHYKVTFLRGRREGSHIEISEIVDARDTKEAVDIALKIAETARWHIEKVERVG